MINFYDLYWKINPDQLGDFPYKWPVISKVIPTNKKMRILDYGCGTGHIFKKIQEMNPESTLIGADISPLAVKSISKRFKKNKFHVVFDGKKLPIKTSSIDFIAAFDVIEHTVDTDLLLKEFHRVLSPKGRILISTPYHGVIKNILISLIGFETVFDPFGVHIRFFTKQSLQEALKKRGFALLSNGFYGRFAPLWRGMYVLAEKL